MCAWALGDLQLTREGCSTAWILNGLRLWWKSNSTPKNNQELISRLFNRKMKILKRKIIICKICNKIIIDLLFNYIDCTFLKSKIQLKVFKPCYFLQNCISLTAYLHRECTRNQQIETMNIRCFCTHLNGRLVMKILSKLLLFNLKTEPIQRTIIEAKIMIS